MTYNQVQDGDENIVETDYVKFDAFFLRDLDGDGYAESIRGSCRKIEQNDTLYMELNVIDNGQFEDGIITINGNNFSLQTAIPKDNEIKENVIGNNIREIKFNTIKNGTQKLLTGVTIATIENNINNYHKINSVTLKGTHVADDGTRTEIEKTVEFTIDWHGTVKAECTGLYQEQNLQDAINEEEGTFTLEKTIGIEEVNNQLLLKSVHVEAQIPELNGYPAEKVELVGTNGTATYDSETKKLTIDNEAKLDENGNIIKRVEDSSYGSYKYNNFKIKITYPLEAYRVIDGDAVEIKIPVKGYYEGFNNDNEEFKNPYVSNVANSTFVLSLSNPRGTVAIFDVTVGKYMGTPRSRHIVSKEKPIKVYNEISEPQNDDTYIVSWYGTTGSDGKSTGMIMKENPEEAPDKFVKIDSSTISMEEFTTNIGIYFSNPESMLGKDGWINVYDNETDELLETFTKANWDKYNSNNPYKYQRPVNHIRIETSETNADAYIYVYNVKKLDDEKITTQYTREEFDNLQYIRSSIVGYLGGKIINTDVHSAEYEAPYANPEISINKDVISTQETEKNMTITIKANAQERLNQTKWSNGAFVVQLPDDIINTEINNVSIDNSNVKIMSYEQFEKDGKNYIKINTENSNPTTFNIKIDCEITPNPQMVTNTESFILYAYNENAIDYWNKTADTLDINDNLNTNEMIGKASTTISLVSPDSLLTSQMVTNYDDKGSVTIAPNIASVEKEQRTADVNVVITNNYSRTISEVKILGRVPFEGNKYVINNGELGSTFTTKMIDTGIIVPEELQGKAVVYYSEKEDATNDLSDSNNNWTTTPTDFSKVKSYLIDLGDYTLVKGENHTFIYTVNVPENTNYNQISYGHHAVYFSLDTAEGKYKTQTEPNKVGIMIAKKYKLELTKYQKDKEKIVSGATYSITEEGTDKTKTRVTNINGKLVLENLYVEKTYIVKEIKTPSNYELNPEEIKFTTTEENGELKLNVISGTTKRAEAKQPQENSGYKIEIDVEDEVRANLKIVKTEKETKIVVPLITYKLTGKNFENGRTVRTNKDGEVVLRGLRIGEEYTLEEIKAEGYYIETPIKFTIENNNGTYTVNIIEGQIKTNEITEIDSIPTIILNIENEKIPRYNLQINKIAKGEEIPLQGAKFRLFKGTEKIDDYTTDENGIITINDLYQYEETKGIDQTYTLKELLAPEGYSAIKDITFKVSKNAEGLLVMDIQEGKIKEQTVGENNTVIITIEDSKSFKLTKTDGETGEVLPNTKFAIYSVENGTQEIARDSKNNILGTKETINGKEYYTLTTNEKGEIEADLKEGLYKAIEVKASHDKYDLTDNTYYFGIGGSREGKEKMVPEWETDWTDEFGNFSYINSIAATADGGWIAGGEADYYDAKQGGMIVKYDSNGGIEWSTTIRGGIIFSINSVAETSDGIIAGGYFRGTIQIGDISYTDNGNVNGIIIKYNNNGEVEWSKAIDGSSDVYINSVAGTSDGIIVGGYFKGTIEVGDNTYTSNENWEDGIIIKYSATGEEEWVSTFGGNSDDKINSVAETSDGIIAGGYFKGTVQIGDNTYTSNGGKDGIIIKYDNDGGIHWSTTIDGNSDIYVNSVAKIGDGGVVAGGSFAGTVQIGDDTYTCNGSSEGIIVEYDNAGGVKWSAKSEDDINSVAATLDGGVIAGNDSIKIIKYDSNGRREWIEKSSYPIKSVAETANKRVIAGGSQEVSYNGNWGGITKYKSIEIPNTVITPLAIHGIDDNVSINATVTTADGGIIAGGYFTGTIEIGGKTYEGKEEKNGIIIKYDRMGDIEWSKAFQSNDYANIGEMDAYITRPSTEINKIIVTNDNGYIVLGDFSGELEVGNNVFKTEVYEQKAYGDVYIGYNTAEVIIKYSTAGEEDWSTTIGGSELDKIESVAATADEGIVAGGSFSGTIQVGDRIYTSKGNNDGIIIKYNNNGDIDWSTTIGGSELDKIESVVATADEGVVAGGSFSGTIQVGDRTYTSNGNQDGIIIKYRNNGDIEWSATFGGNSDDKVNSVAETSDGIIAGGTFSGTVQVGDIPYTSNGGSDGIIIKYREGGIIEWVATYGESDYESIKFVAATANGEIMAGGDLSDDAILLKVVAYTSISETEVLQVENNRKEFKITTDVKEIDGVKGGNISGEDESPYETVKYEDNSTKEIIMTPDENYEIISITVNGEEWPFTSNEDGTYTMPQFENMTENKHIVVTYALKDNKIIINKIDSKTKEPIADVKFKLDQIEERANPENVIGKLKEQTITEVEITDNEISGVLGELKEQTIIETEIIDNEIIGTLGELTNIGDSGYYFIKNEVGAYVPTNIQIDDTTAHSYIPIDLTGYTGTYAVKINANVSSEDGCDYGYATIREDITVPEYDNSIGQFINISGTEGGEYTSEALEGGKIYYLHLGYYKDGSEYDGDDQVVFNNIKVYEAKKITSPYPYRFIKENGIYKSNNQETDDTTAHSYIPIDLSGYTGTYAVKVNANVSSEAGYDYGYATIKEDTTAPEYYDSTGQFMQISGTEGGEYTSEVLEGGKIYYLHLGYYKDGSGQDGDDQVVFNSIKVYEGKEVLKPYPYNFIEEDGKYKSTNQGKSDTICNSYVPIDLTGYSGTFKLTVNAEISSDWSDYGYATITEDTTAPEYYDETGRFIYIYGEEEAQDYTTVLAGGKIYYLHLGYRKDSSTDEGEDTFTINSMRIEPNDGDLYRIEITTNSEGQAIMQIPFGKYTLTEISTPTQYTKLEKPVIIEFKGDNRAVITNENKAQVTVNEQGEFVVENIPKANVTVHHYLKDRDGNYTTTEVAEDEIIYGDIDKNYSTIPHLDLEKYDIEKDINNQYIIPENATGIFRENNEDVIYYYEERQYPVIVHHYIKGTTTPVPLADGTTAKDEKMLGYVGDTYETKVKENLAYGYGYESVVGQVIGTHIDGTIEVTYYYEALTYIEVTKKWDNTNNIYDKPDSVTIEILADGKMYKNVILTKENKVIVEGESENQETWKYSPIVLPKYDEYGHEIVYRVREK